MESTCARTDSARQAYGKRQQVPPVQLGCNARTEGLSWLRQGESICSTELVEDLIRDIRHLIEAGHHGQVVAIDVGSGSYALGENAIAESDGLREQHTGAQVWLMRAGH